MVALPHPKLNPSDNHLIQSFINLPENASEAIVSQNFISPLLAALGFEKTDIVPEFSTGSGNKAVDYAARKTGSGEAFVQTQTDPNFLLELKGKDVNLEPNSRQYERTVKQLKDYCLSPNCKTVQWGMIANGKHIQLFRKHGKVIYPATPCIELNAENIIDGVTNIRQQIEAPKRALTVAVYNNKGGVGKTTTTVNLGGILTLAKKKVLLIDLDKDQQDLTHSLGIKMSQPSLYDCMKDKQSQVKTVIQSFKYKTQTIDVIAADKSFADESENQLKQNFKIHRLRQVLEQVQSEYDYILIDAPPNWRLLSVSAVYAADVVLVPTKHNNIFSLKNAATAIQNYIPSVQKERNDGGPTALPIFFNGEKMTETQRETVNKAIHYLIAKFKRDFKFDLLPYFYPRYTSAKKNCTIFELPNSAYIANAAFSQVPAVYKSKPAREYYLALAKEYFIQ